MYMEPRPAELIEFYPFSGPPQYLLSKFCSGSWIPIHTDKINVEVHTIENPPKREIRFLSFSIALATRLKNQRNILKCESDLFMFIYLLQNFIPLLSTANYKNTLICFF